MAGSIAAVKKELRNKIKSILKELPDAAASSQCTLLSQLCKSQDLIISSFKRYQDAAIAARVQGCSQDKRIFVNARWRDLNYQYCARRT
jgi:hypothetical protein